MTSVGAVVPLYDHGAMFTMEEVKEYMMTGYNLGPRLLADPGTPRWVTSPATWSCWARTTWVSGGG